MFFLILTFVIETNKQNQGWKWAGSDITKFGIKRLWFAWTMIVVVLIQLCAFLCWKCISRYTKMTAEKSPSWLSYKLTLTYHRIKGGGALLDSMSANEKSKLFGGKKYCVSEFCVYNVQLVILRCAFLISGVQALRALKINLWIMSLIEACGEILCAHL